MTEAIAQNLSRIRAEINGAQLIAVSKGQDTDKITAALNAEQRVFGENYVQEAAKKWPALRARFADVELHLIGPLQSNKAKNALELFDVIQTLDRDSLAKELLKYPGLLTGKKFFIQVNIGREDQKSGVMPEEAEGFIKKCIHDYKLPVIGLMAIPPDGQNATPYFQELAQIAARHNLKQLSMGMSADYKQAITCGATLVRIGTAVFGARKR
jgi:pyridoxal phosphate enzyme (YggS family)